MNDLKHILITGATGYIGHRLGNELRSTYFVHKLVRTLPQEKLPGVQYHPISDSNSIRQVFEKNKIDTVIHLASKAQYDWNAESIPEFIKANIEFGSLLLEAMSEFGCSKFLNTSTYWQEYSATNPVPICYYAATKAAFENILEFYTFDKALKTISLRLHDVYGPNDPRPKLFSQLKEASKKGEPLKMTPGQQVLYFTHVNDVLSAYKTALERLDSMPSGKSEKYDVRGKPYTLKDAIDIYLKINGLNLEINWGALAYRKNQIMNPSLLDTPPNWMASTDIREGFKDL